MKIKRRFITIIILMIIILNYILVPNIALAQIVASEVCLYSKGTYSSMLQYDGQDLDIEYVVYEYQGIEYPAYSLNYLGEQVSVDNSYLVNVERCKHFAVWEILYWGYPYKTSEELGCQTDIEAYIATELATACILNRRKLGKLSAVDQQGERILNAINQIVNIVITTETGKPKFNIYASTDEVEWTIDECDPRYMSKTYSMIYNDCEYETITPRLFGDVPTNTIITDIYNQEKLVFNKDEQFKVLIPIESLDRNGDIILEILIEGKAYTVLQGTSQNDNQKTYILTTDKLESLVCTTIESYTKQNSNTEDNTPPIDIPDTEPKDETDTKQEDENKTDTEQQQKDRKNKEKKQHTSVDNKATQNNVINTRDNREENNMITNVINTEIIDIISIMEYINQLKESQLQARVAEPTEEIEDITEKNNMIHQKEVNELTNVKKLPRTGY